MAVVNKDYRIKHGLVVEGTTATVNGYDVLTKSTSDNNYIIGLIGGSATSNATPDTVVLRDGNADFSAGTITANLHGDVTATTLTLNDGASNSSIYAGGNDLTVYGHNNLYLNTNNADIILQPDGSAKIWNDVIATRPYADYVAGNAQTAAQVYADSLASNYDPAGAAYDIGVTTLQAANSYTDNKVADLVGLAPTTLDTLQELAAALDNNPDIITNLENIAAGKQDALTSGDGINISSNIISAVTESNGGLTHSSQGLAIKRSVVDTWYDAAGAASTAESNAKNYADGLASNYDAAGAAATAESNANSYTDTAISNGNSNAEPQYKGIKYGWMAEDTANYTWASSDAQVTAISWNVNYASAKILVRLRNGNHSQVSEVILTLDASNNIHMTEYGIVTTNGILGEITAEVSGNNINLLITPTYNTGTDIITHATLMAWGD